MGNEKDGGDGNIHDGNSPSSQNSRPPVSPSNNFENYWRMKMKGREQKKERNHPNVTQEEERSWNHFTTPLNPSHKEQSPSPTPPADQSKPKYSTPSVFSDLERSQTVDRFSKIFTERIGEVMSSGKLSKAWQSSSDGDVGGSGSSIFSWLSTDYSLEANTNQPTKINPNDYAAERKMIQPHLSPFIWGSSCMMVTLFSLRLGRWYQGGNAGRTLGSSFNKTGHTAGRSSSQGTSNNVKSLQDVRRTGQHQSNNTNNPFNPRKELTDSLKASLATLPVDIALSMLIGISTSIFLTRSSLLMKDLSNSPLSEGKSVLAEELCLPFREEMTNVNGMSHLYTPYNANTASDVPAQKQVVPYSDLWRDENLGEFDSLRSIRDFVVNCHEREMVAKQTVVADWDNMSEQELMEVKILPPGISPNLAVGEFDESDTLE